MRRVLVWRGKHETCYFAADTDEELAKSSLKLMRLLNDDYQYYWEPSLDSYTRGATSDDDMTDEQIEALPSEELQAVAKKRRGFWRNGQKLWQQAHTLWAEGQRILEEGDVSVRRIELQSRVNPEKKIVNTIIPAWDFLRARADHQYEHVCLESVIDPDKD